ncbi:MAG: translation initiation factor IF-2 [Candidatus Izemoplasmataceae bacterium]
MAKRHQNNNTRRRPNRRRPNKQAKRKQPVKPKGPIKFKEGLTVSELSQMISVPISTLLKKLMTLGTMVNQNQPMDKEAVELIAMEYDLEVEEDTSDEIVRFEELTTEDAEADLEIRPPVVTIMGHVDHGKTTLLDTIRNARVTEGEAGGITQHIGAYRYFTDQGESITFIDTPGHAAFTEMRARGAKITDIAILVVAADDGVMPQTREAIDHVKAADVPVIVAVNKMDVPGANPDKVKQELAEFNLIPEEWGGETIFVELSALKGEGVDTLIEMITLTAEVAEIKANPNREAHGHVIEAELDKGRGPVATLLVQNGTLKAGDILVVGDTYGRVRAMTDDFGKNVENALPSMAVEVIGLSDVPQAGDPFMVFDDERKARQIAEKRAENTWKEEHGVSKSVSLDDMFAQFANSDKKQLNVIIKGDTQGSIEALKGALEQIDVEGANVSVIRSSVGTITETDVTLALASQGIIIGFNVRPNAAVRDDAREKGVEIRLYSVIYKAIEDVEMAMKGMLDPEYEEVITGQAEVRDTFKVSKIGTVAGCYVTDGTIQRDSTVRVIRDGVVIYEGDLSSLKRFKDDAKEVRQGFECGITIDKFNDIKVGDIIEASVMKEVER